MMNATLRAALILVSVGTFFLMMRKIRQSKVQIESAIFWIVLAIILVVYSIFPSAADLCARILGIYSTANFLFLFAIFLRSLLSPARTILQIISIADSSGKAIVFFRFHLSGTAKKQMGKLPPCPVRRQGYIMLLSTTVGRHT